MSDYANLLHRKSQLDGMEGFEPVWEPDFLFPFQAGLVDWSIRKGRAAIFADCGLGKTPMQLVWAENVARHTGRPVLVLTPLAVAYQTAQEAQKFGIDASVSRDGRYTSPITVTNYDRIHLFDSTKVAGVVCDESSAIKAFDGTRRAEVTAFMRKAPYRLLCTATAAPNDYIELGTSSEALGHLGHMDMLSRFFINNLKNSASRYQGKQAEWRFKGHAEQHFWRWVASWARAMRRPSDLGFDDDGFDLPPLRVHQHVVEARTTRPDTLFDMPATSLIEEREEQRRTLVERCEKVAELAVGTDPFVAWCQLNDEADTLVKMIPGAVQVSGSDDPDEKERKLIAFSRGEIRVLVTKPIIGAWGLNWQHCSRMAFFPSHSYEQYYQAIRRSWRFGQKNPVDVHIVTTEGGSNALKYLTRKSDQGDQMFRELVLHMTDAMNIDRTANYTRTVEVPSWAS